MNKRPFFLFALAVSLMTTVSGCASQSADSQTAQITQVGTETTQAYTNSTYGFSLTFPKSWGDIVESKGGDIGKEINVAKNWTVFSGDVQGIPDRVKLLDSIRLVSKNDSERFIQIQVVKNEGNDKYTFYYIASKFLGDGEGPGMTAEDLKIGAEISEIVKSFSLKKVEADVTAGRM